MSHMQLAICNAVELDKSVFLWFGETFCKVSKWKLTQLEKHASRFQGNIFLDG